VTFYREEELRQHALKSLVERPEQEANDLLKVYLLSAGFIQRFEEIDLNLKMNWIDLVNRIGTTIDKTFEAGNKMLFIFKKINTSKTKKIVEDYLNKDLRFFFTTLILFKPNHLLLKELAEEALTIFLEPENQLMINVALNTVNYIESGKDDAFLETLNPDMAIAVKAIIQKTEL